jgi:eukaryotic-like serine/threonine-protein kinase
MAEIFLARFDGPKGFAKQVVIKRVLPELAKDEGFAAMFLDEARLSARLSHPNIVQAFEIGEEAGSLYLVLEYAPGESISRLVKHAVNAGSPVPPGPALRIGMQVLEALDYAHNLTAANGARFEVVHRDVSPGNVIVSYDGTVKLLDFGIARAVTQQHQTLTGTVKGKPGYMSPEQALAMPVDHRSDIYGVGSLLYLLTTGAAPFEGLGNAMATMRAAVEGRFVKPGQRNPALSPEVERIILKAMSLEAQERYPTAARMFEELEQHALSAGLRTSARSLMVYMRHLSSKRAEPAPADAASKVKTTPARPSVLPTAQVQRTPRLLSEPSLAPTHRVPSLQAQDGGARSPIPTLPVDASARPTEEARSPFAGAPGLEDSEWGSQRSVRSNIGQFANYGWGFALVGVVAVLLGVALLWLLGGD